MLSKDARIGDVIDEVSRFHTVKRLIITSICNGRVDYIYSNSNLKEWKRSRSYEHDAEWNRRTVLYNLKDIPELLCQI